MSIKLLNCAGFWIDHMIVHDREQLFEHIVSSTKPDLDFSIQITDTKWTMISIMESFYSSWRYVLTGAEAAFQLVLMNISTAIN